MLDITRCISFHKSHVPKTHPSDARFLNRTGTDCGVWEIVGYTGQGNGRASNWLYECRDCGNRATAIFSKLGPNDGYCQCSSAERREIANKERRRQHGILKTHVPRAHLSDKRFKNLTGQVFGRLEVVGYVGRWSHKTREGAWLCRCECGASKVASSATLKSGSTSSCGCLLDEWKTKPKHVKHGYATKIWYVSYMTMVYRCQNPDRVGYENYGGRGISVCQRWLEDPLNFLEDVGQRPSREYSIDRIDVNGNYEPANVRWATREEQGQNTTLTRLNPEKVREIRKLRSEGLEWPAIHKRVAPLATLACVVHAGTRRTWKNIN